jgi:hypothetical protein
VPALGKEDIRRFDVSMDNAFRVRGVQPFGYLYRNLQYRLQFQRATGNHVFQSFAFQIFHGDERSAVFFPDVMNRADVRMVQR